MNTRNDIPGSSATTTEQKPESIKEAVKGFVDQGREKVEQTRVRVIEVKDRAISKGNALIDRTTDMIKTHPLKAVGIAFGAGYIGMRLFRR